MSRTPNATQGQRRSDTGAMEQATRRWRTLVRARTAETKRLEPAHDPGTSASWDRRARRFSAMAESAEAHPLLHRVLEASWPQATVLDVGSGPGRFSLALAPHVAEVVAVDPSQAMLRILEREVGRRRLDNVRTVPGRFEDVDAPAADLAICCYVLPLVGDAARFLAKLDEVCRRRAFLCLSALATDVLFDPLWRHFHGRPRKPGPTWLDAVAVLDELGIRAGVEIVEVPVRARFSSLQRAVSDYRDNLLLPDTTEVRRELRRVLRAWLVERDGGLAPPLSTMPVALVSWTPSSAARRRA